MISAQSAVKGLLTWMVKGEQFKRYTRPNPAAEPGPMYRIAVCHLIPSLGDAVMLFSLLDMLREQHPDAEITVFTAGMGEILHQHPGVARGYHFRRPGGLWGRLGKFGYIHDLWQWWHRELRGLRFDLCVVLRGGVDPFHGAHLAWLLGGRERVGYDWRLEPERGKDGLSEGALFTRQVEELRAVHEVDRCVEILRLAGLLPAQVDRRVASEGMLALARRPEAQRFVAEISALRERYVVVSLGASMGRREWREEGFLRVAEAVSRRGWTTVFVGGPEVAARTQRLVNALSGPVLNLAGQTSVEQLAAVCAGALGFVGNDTGTAHVAGACGTPVLVISCFARSGRRSHHASLGRSMPAGVHAVGVEPERQLAPCTEECVSQTAHCIRQVAEHEVLRAFDLWMDEILKTEAGVR